MQPLESRVLLAGGPELLKDIRQGNASSNPLGMVEMNGVLYFRAIGGAWGDELWRSDGTAGGTYLVKDIESGPSGSEIKGVTSVGGRLYFNAYTSATGGELWTSDGTAQGTVMVKDISSGGGSEPGNFVAYKGEVYFVAAAAGTGFELWKTNGTAEGTALVKDIAAGGTSSNVGELTVHNGLLYFRATDSRGAELWRTDGTTQGTRIVTDLVPGSGSSSPESLFSSGEELLFSAASGGGFALHKTDGTEAGTSLLKPVPAGGMVALNDSTVLFVARDQANGSELWRTDGTPGGTVLVKDVNTGAADGVSAGLAVLNGIAYFAGGTTNTGLELWRSDGTPEGTQLVREIRAGNMHSRPRNFVRVGGRLYFVVNAGGNTDLNEVWATDGTTAGTVKIGDMATYWQTTQLTVAGTQVFYVHTDPTVGAELFRYETDPLRPPTANVAGPYSVGEGGSVQLRGWATPNPVNPVTYEWDLDGDGVFGETGAAASRGAETGLEPSFNAAGLDGPSTHPVTFRIRGSDGRFSTASADISVVNARPVLSISGTGSGIEGTVYSITLSAADPGVDTIHAWAVDWGDGTPRQVITGEAARANPLTLNHTIADGPWFYGVRVWATDEDGTYSATTPVRLDDTFGTAGGVVDVSYTTHTDVASAVAVQPDGKVLVAGSFTYGGGGYWLIVSRLDVDGSLDPTFGGAGRFIFKAPDYWDTHAASITLLGDGRIVVTGSASSIPYGGKALVLRLNSDGTPDLTFNDVGYRMLAIRTFGGFSRAGAMPDGRVVVGGGGGGDGTNEMCLVRYTGDGRPDDTFGSSGKVCVPVPFNSSLRAMSVLRDGKVLASASNDNRIFRFDMAGKLDPTFGVDGVVTAPSGNVSDLASLPDGRFLALAGSSLTRFKADGSVDPDFGVSGSTFSSHTQIALLPDGSIFGAGGGVSHWLPDGTLDTDYAAGGTFGTPFGQGGFAVRGDGAVHLVGKPWPPGSRAQVVRLTPDAFSVRTANVKPTVSVGGPASLPEGSTYLLSLSRSDPGTDHVRAWEIDWGDGVIELVRGDPASVGHLYADNGVYPIRATAFDEDGVYAAAARSVTVQNVAPSVDAGPSSRSSGLIFSATGAFTDPGDDLWAATVDFGDGSGLRPLELRPDKTFSLTHTYAAAGSYQVTVVVRDVNGATGSDAIVLNVEPPFPGDVNTDGLIDIADYFRIDRARAQGLVGFTNGDFNSDMRIDADDYIIIDRAFISERQQPGTLASAAPAPAPLGLGGGLMGPQFEGADAGFLNEGDAPVLA